MTKIYYEKDAEGSRTGVTMVRTEDGFLGFSFCYPDKLNQYPIYHRETGELIDLAYSVKRGDEFNRKLGRSMAEGRALKLKRLISEEGLSEEEATKKIYNPRMIKNIKAFMKRNSHLFTEE